MKRSTPLKRSGTLARGGRLAPRSAKRTAEAELRRDVVLAVKARDRYCRAERTWAEVACAGPLDVHEPNARSRNQGDWLDADRCVLLCRAHHSAVHDNPRRARELGLLR